MFCFSPTRNSAEAAEHLELLVRTPDHHRFTRHIRRLHELFRTAVATCPAPLAEAGLAVTPELRCQSEHYLPLACITDAFYLLYRENLTYPPLLTSTPFHQALSWADLYAGLPRCFQVSPNPAILLATLLTDQDLRHRFLFYSFLPRRFYGGFNRYPGQSGFVLNWLKGRTMGTARCLDAACGTGEQSYGLARLLSEHNVAAPGWHIAGWTIEPLEVWAAACGVFRHDPRHEVAFRQNMSHIFDAGRHECLKFSVVDLLNMTAEARDARFDLILCNGLLGGPILHEWRQLMQVVQTLAGLLAPGGILLVADNFHDGWKQKHPQAKLRVLLETAGLNVCEAGEGLGATKPL